MKSTSRHKHTNKQIILPCQDVLQDRFKINEFKLLIDKVQTTLVNERRCEPGRYVTPGPSDQQLVTGTFKLFTTYNKYITLNFDNI